MTVLAVVLAAATFANATVVSTDTTQRTLTIRSADGRAEVLAVDGTALARLAELKAGDEVILTVQGAEGARRTVTRIERSVRRARPPARKRSGVARRAPASPPPGTPPSGASPKPAPTAGTGRPSTDAVGPLQDPRRGAQQDPRVNPNRDPRVIPGLTVPLPSPRPTSSPSPSPSPTPTPD
jgi:hypothetical protein